MGDVLSLWDRKKKSEEKSKEEETLFDFSQVEERNKKIKEKVEKERSQHNRNLAGTLKPRNKKR